MAESDLQVLASVMFQKNHAILEDMHIDSDAIIINQCNQNKIEEFEYNNCNIKFLSLNERGIGISRNNALIRATAKYVLFADDDEVFVKNYKNIIVEEYKKHPDADMIIFNVKSINPNRQAPKIDRFKKVSKFNCLRYGAWNFSIKTDFIRKNSICFNQLFGGGSRYGAGEDSLFIYNVLQKGGRVYACPKQIATIAQEESTWFNGYNEKFFFDKGAFYATLTPKISHIMCLQLLLRHRYMYKEIGFSKAWNQIKKGVVDVQKR